MRKNYNKILVHSENFLHNSNLLAFSGLRYSIKRLGTGPRPKRGSRLRILYNIWIGGNLGIERFVVRNKLTVFRIGSGKVFKWFELAARCLKKGGSGYFFIPRKLALKDIVTLFNIPRDKAIICKMKLIDFDPPLRSRTILAGNPYVAMAEFSGTLCCISNNKVFFSKGIAKMIKKLFVNPMSLSELFKNLSKYFHTRSKFINFIENAIDNEILLQVH